MAKKIVFTVEVDDLPEDFSIVGLEAKVLQGGSEKIIYRAVTVKNIEVVNV